MPVALPASGSNLRIGGCRSESSPEVVEPARREWDGYGPFQGSAWPVPIDWLPRDGFGIPGPRQRERECRSHPELARHPDPTTVEFHELPAQRQPEARALGLPVRGAHLAKLLEYRV